MVFSIVRKMNCIIYEKHKNLPFPVVKQNQQAILIHYQTSIEQPLMYKGHLFVEPKRHIEVYADLTKEESDRVADLIHFGTQAQKRVLNPEHTYIFTIMHQVAHLHFHLVPRYAGMPEKYWHRGLHDWPNAPRLDCKIIVHLSKVLS
jgi:histidine triad (HIT) family protein